MGLILSPENLSNVSRSSNNMFSSILGSLEKPLCHPHTALFLFHGIPLWGLWFQNFSISIAKTKSIPDKGHPVDSSLQIKIKGCLWLTCRLIILDMKADNELAIGLPVYFNSVKKWKYIYIYKEIQQPRKKEKKLNSRPWTCKGNVKSIGPRQLILKMVVKLIILYISCLWNSVGGCCLKLVELYLWRDMYYLWRNMYIRGKQARFWP